jgi:hypothetical protein
LAPPFFLPITPTPRETQTECVLNRIWLIHRWRQVLLFTLILAPDSSVTARKRGKEDGREEGCESWSGGAPPPPLGRACFVITYIMLQQHTVAVMMQLLQISSAPTPPSAVFLAV